MLADLVNHYTAPLVYICYLSTFQIQLANLQQLMPRPVLVLVDSGRWEECEGVRCGEPACSRYKGFSSSPALHLHLHLNLARIDDCNHWFVLAGQAETLQLLQLLAALAPTAVSPGNRGSAGSAGSHCSAAHHITSSQQILQQTSKHPTLPALFLPPSHKKKTKHNTDKANNNCSPTVFMLHRCFHTPAISTDYAEKFICWKKH